MASVPASRKSVRLHHVPFRTIPLLVMLVLTWNTAHARAHASMCRRSARDPASMGTSSVSPTPNPGRQPGTLANSSLRGTAAYVEEVRVTSATTAVGAYTLDGRLAY